MYLVAIMAAQNRLAHRFLNHPTFLIPYFLFLISYLYSLSSTAQTLSSFSPGEVTLLPGSPFYHARQKDSAYIMLMEPNRLLHRFHRNARRTTAQRKRDWLKLTRAPSTGSG